MDNDLEYRVEQFIALAYLLFDDYEFMDLIGFLNDAFKEWMIENG